MSASITETLGNGQSPTLHMAVPKHASKTASGAESLPHLLGEAFKSSPKLTREQCGHLRHFYNLASQLDGDWAFMGSQEPGQEWDTARRYQLATMAYAAGAAHYHRLPAMRSMFKALLEKLIAKMLHREAWGYWYLTSQSGIRVDPDLKETRKPWADPVCKENIMVSLCLHSCGCYLRTDLRSSIPDICCLWSLFTRCCSMTTNTTTKVVSSSIGIHCSSGWVLSDSAIQDRLFKLRS
jgi:hypothetical protein